MKKLRIGFAGNFEVPYSTENDRKWSFEKLGHEVITFQENKTTANDLLNAQNIDVLFYSHTHGWHIDNLTEVFRVYKQAGIPTASVHLDRWAWLARESDVGKEATWFTEYQFMADGSPEAVELYEKHNLNWYWIKPGVVERDCYMAQPDKSRFPHDIIFVGSRGYHPEYPFRTQLVDWLKETYGDQFGHHGGDGSDGGTIRGHDLNVLYASAKVVVGDSCFGGRPRYWSDRITETIGRGGFLIHPKNYGLEDIPFASYEYPQLQDLKKQIDYWLENEQEREKLRADCHKEVHDHHTYTNRAQEILSVILKEQNI